MNPKFPFGCHHIGRQSKDCVQVLDRRQARLASRQHGNAVTDRAARRSAAVTLARRMDGNRRRPNQLGRAIRRILTFGLACSFEQIVW
jgi:hypothetical protein